MICVLDHQNAPEPLKLLKKAKAGLLQQKVTIQLTKGNARKLRSLDGKKEIDVVEMADEILSKYLRRNRF
jgi:hypothetical protein